MDDNKERYWGERMRKLMVIIGLAVAMASTAACNGEDATLTLYHPESIEADGYGEFLAILDGATPMLGLVYWYPFVDLDGDEYPDRNEYIGSPPYYSGADRIGRATYDFFLQPDSFFEALNLSLPDEIDVGVRANLYSSDTTSPVVVRTVIAEIEIDSGE